MQVIRTKADYTMCQTTHLFETTGHLGQNMLVDVTTHAVKVHHQGRVIYSHIHSMQLVIEVEGCKFKETLRLARSLQLPILLSLSC